MFLIQLITLMLLLNLYKLNTFKKPSYIKLRSVLIK